MDHTDPKVLLENSKNTSEGTDFPKCAYLLWGLVFPVPALDTVLELPLVDDAAELLEEEVWPLIKAACLQNKPRHY